MKVAGFLKWYQMAKKIIKVGLAKTKEKDDCIRSEKKERFIAQAARG